MAKGIEEARLMVAAHEHWYHQIEVVPGLVTPGINDSQQILDALRLPERLDDLRVLDIGARDGFFSFECERRGADVVAIDSMPPEATGFSIAKELVGSQVEMLQWNVYELSPEQFGTFDLILFLGVLYHLRDPMLALDKIWSVARDKLIVETQMIDEALLVGPGEFKRLADLNPELEEIPLMQFYPGASLNGDATNMWAPNQACLAAMLAEAGFAVQDQTPLGQQRGLAFAERKEDWMLDSLKQHDRASGSKTA
jgi:tRNA (mo5U34)-methyltransferase